MLQASSAMRARSAGGAMRGPVPMLTVMLAMPLA